MTTLTALNDKEMKDIELDLLLEAIFRRWGYDFRHYARASLKRRFEQRLAASGLECLSEMLPRLLRDEDFFNDLLVDLSVTVTEMFRDPSFHAAMREHVLPVLKTYPFIRIWHAGCATGEEVYSMAILLEEEGLYHRSHIYATDYNKNSLDIARNAVYSLDDIRLFTANYQAAGGKASFSDYYHAKYNAAKINDSLRENITFAYHNLVTDQVFGEMHLIVCRNVLIYFDKDLQDQTLSLFSDSLCRRGFLCLGNKETLDFTCIRDEFDTISAKERIFRGARSPVPSEATF